jgi:hypothetical protein
VERIAHPACGTACCRRTRRTISPVTDRIDLSNGYDVRCTMHSRAEPVDCRTSSRVSLAGVQTTLQTLPRFSKLNGVTHSHAHFECTLPPSSAIVSYEMDED